jgi:hypothetical protein
VYLTGYTARRPHDSSALLEESAPSIHKDVCRFYRHLEIPGVYDASDPLSLQIFRGIFAYGGEPGVGVCQRAALIFHKFKAIPEYCFGCYKLLVEPRTVMELFKLILLFEKIRLPQNNRRKCMVENRPSCSGTYKGYIYCGGLKESEQVYALVRKAVSNEISPDIPMHIKRGCSEFAAAYPKYGVVKPGVEPMKYNEDWRVFEEYFDKHAKWVPRDTNDGKDEMDTTYKPSEIFAMTYFLHYAATIGDDSYLEIAGRTLASLQSVKRPPFVSPAPPARRRAYRPAKWPAQSLMIG